ncbi:hypothetical protein BASA83_005795 [Batrachochytrium salamandrivorans]|nr:hypothetical protein BASA83_005795 [Batrachochytrium salamandrivorans]
MNNHCSYQGDLLHKKQQSIPEQSSIQSSAIQQQHQVSIPDEFDDIIGHINDTGSDVPTDLGTDLSPMNGNSLADRVFLHINSRSPELLEEIQKPLLQQPLLQQQQLLQEQRHASNRYRPHMQIQTQRLYHPTDSPSTYMPAASPRSMGVHGLRQGQIPPTPALLVDGLCISDAVVDKTEQQLYPLSYLNHHEHINHHDSLLKPISVYPSYNKSDPTLIAQIHPIPILPPQTPASTPPSSASMLVRAFSQSHVTSSSSSSFSYLKTGPAHSAGRRRVHSAGAPLADENTHNDHQSMTVTANATPGVSRSKSYFWPTLTLPLTRGFKARSRLTSATSNILTMNPSAMTSNPQTPPHLPNPPPLLPFHKSDASHAEISLSTLSPVNVQQPILRPDNREALVDIDPLHTHYVHRSVHSTMGKVVEVCTHLPLGQINGNIDININNSSGNNSSSSSSSSSISNGHDHDPSHIYSEVAVLPSLSPMTPFDPSFPLLPTLEGHPDSKMCLEREDTLEMIPSVAAGPTRIDKISNLTETNQQQMQKEPPVTSYPTLESRSNTAFTHPVVSTLRRGRRRAYYTLRRHTVELDDLPRQGEVSDWVHLPPLAHHHHRRHKGSLGENPLISYTDSDGRQNKIKRTHAYAEADYYGCLYPSLPKHINDMIIKRDRTRSRKWSDMSRLQSRDVVKAKERSSSSSSSTAAAADLSTCLSLADLDPALTTVSHQFLLHRKFVSRLTKGIPQAWRGLVWLELFSQRSGVLNHSNGSSFFEKATELLMKYKECLASKCTQENEIAFDAAHTMQYHISFISKCSPSVKALGRIMRAITVLDTDLGYHKNIMMWVALLLTITNEENAFLIAKCILEKATESNPNLCRSVYPSYCDKARRDRELCRTHGRLLEQCAPKLSKKLTLMGITPDQYLPLWMETLFVSCFNPTRSVAETDPRACDSMGWTGLLPLGALLRLWDLFALHGYHFMVCASVALVKMYKGDLLGMKVVEAKYALLVLTNDPLAQTLLHSFTPLTDIDRFIQVCVAVWVKSSHESQ